jgi:hypothetical protein
MNTTPMTIQLIGMRTPPHSLLTALNSGHIPTLPNPPTTTHDTPPNATLIKSIPRVRLSATRAHYPRMTSPPPLG